MRAAAALLTLPEIGAGFSFSINISFAINGIGVDIFSKITYNFTHISGKEEPHMIQSLNLFSTNNMMMCMYTEGSSPDLADA